MPDKPEVWLRGPLSDIPPLLQPAAHALLQAREEINEFMKGFPDHLLWEKPNGVASPGFHLKHLTGVLDRLLSYARTEQLNGAQLEYLSKEEHSTFEGAGETEHLLHQFNTQVDKALLQFSGTDEVTLTSPRGVGRAQLPSTVIGLLFHAAEHTQRHTGQLMVTARILHP
ncbi:MAG: DinB family protein [Agriterribacter sp.]